MDILNLIKECGDTAFEKGFWNAHRWKAQDILEQEFLGKPHDEMTDEEVEEFKYGTPSGTTLYADEVQTVISEAVETLAQKLIIGDPTIYMALMVSELGEGIEAYRKGNFVGKDGVAEELADTCIRIFDFIARFGERMGFTPEEWVKILTDKMTFNKTRPPLHGKGF